MPRFKWIFRPPAWCGCGRGLLAAGLAAALLVWPSNGAGQATSAQLKTLQRLTHAAPDSAVRLADQLLRPVAPPTAVRAEILMHRATAQRNLNQPSLAQKTLLTALALPHLPPILHGQLLMSMGLVLHQARNLPEAERYLREALAVHPPTDSLNRAKLYSNYGNLLGDKGDQDAALRAYQNALALTSPRTPPLIFTNLYHNIAVVYGMKGDIKRSEEYERRALASETRAENLLLRATIKLTLGSLYLEANQPEKARPLLLETQQLLPRVHSLEIAVALNRNLAHLYQMTGQYDKALATLERAITQNDSMLRDAHSAAMAEMETQYQVNRRREENKLLQARQQLTAAQLRQSEIWLVVAGVGAVLLLALVVALWRNNALARERNALLDRQKRLVELEKVEIEKQNAELARAKLQAQYDNLQSRLNPHFLFNSLSALSGLLVTDVARAREFLDHFASFYRQLLENHEQPTISLGEELELTESYLFMMRSRFGDNLRVQLDVAPETVGRRLPPLTLQMVLENAIKHNVVARTAPLTIAIRTTARGVEVRNNLNPRARALTESTHTGQRLIRSRYEILGAPAPTFAQTATEYVVTLPLLA